MSKQIKRFIIDGTIIGSALFSMFFGAGNMIFPPYLGLKAGTQWFIAFLSYFIADIGFALLAIFALIKSNGNELILKPLGKWASSILMFLVFICIGPLITIPRTAATTFELAIQPLQINLNDAVFYAIFFFIVFILCYKKNAVVDIVGKFLTPLLFLGLMFLIILGVITNNNNIIAAPRSESVIADGVEAGYQSMDVLGGMVFGILILNSFKKQGYTSTKSKYILSTVSSFVAGIGLLIIYLGMTYLGANVSSEYTMHISRTELLTNIIEKLMPGISGILFFGIVAGLACLSTAIAITSAAAEYFSSLTNKKINYKHFVIIICIFDALISLLGVERLIAFASPILSIIYPPMLVMILLSFVKHKYGVWMYRLPAMIATIFAALYVFNFRFLYDLPLAKYGFAWLMPTIAASIMGLTLDKIHYKAKAL